MDINVEYDSDSSKMLEKLTFSCDKFELSRKDVIKLRDKKKLKIKGDDFPEIVPCQVFVHFENFKEAKVIFLNPEFELPSEIYDEPFLNKDLIYRYETNSGFWLEFKLDLNDKGIKFNFKYNNEEK